MLLYNLCDLEEAVPEDPQALMSCRLQVPFTVGVSTSPGVEVQDFDGCDRVGSHLPASQASQTKLLRTL